MLHFYQCKFKQLYDGYEAIVDACCHAWNWFTGRPQSIRTLCTRQ